MSMKLANIIKNSGLDTIEFKRSSEIPITLYDRKNRIIDDPDIKFVKFLFEDNDSSFERFHELLKEIEKTTDTISSIEVKIDEFCVVLRIPGKGFHIFSRVQKIDF